VSVNLDDGYWNLTQVGDFEKKLVISTNKKNDKTITSHMM